MTEFERQFKRLLAAEACVLPWLERTHGRQQNGVSQAIRKRFEEEVKPLPLRFDFDSHENVIKNYEGSYFYRLR
jgi:hypothetical protein